MESQEALVEHWGLTFAQYVLLYVQSNLKQMDSEAECGFDEMDPETWIWVPSEDKWMSCLEVAGQIIFAPKPRKEADNAVRALKTKMTGKELKAALKGLGRAQGLAFGDLVIGVDGLRRLATLLRKEELTLIPEPEEARLRITADRHRTTIKWGAWWDKSPDSVVPVQITA